MALVDTSALSIAVDRSILGPQGRRWIERKLPEIVSSLSFIAVSGFGACLLMYQVCRDYSHEGFHGLFQLPKHLANAVVLHFVARLLRWHVTRVVSATFFPGDDARAMFPFAAASPRAAGGSSGSGIGNKITWPWQQSTAASSRTRDRDFSPSDSDAAPPSPAGLTDTGGESNRASREGSGAPTPTPPSERERPELEDPADDREGQGGSPGAVADPDVTSTALAAAERGSPEHTAEGGGANGAVSGESSSATTAVLEDGRSGGGNIGVTVQQQQQERRDVSLPPARSLAQGVGRALSGRSRPRSRRGGGSGGGGGGGGSSGALSKFYLEEHAAELADGGCFFIKMVDDDSWLFVEDEVHQPEWGWAIRLFHRGYKVAVRYPGEVGRNDAHRLLFQCEPGRHAGYWRLRSRGTNTYLFFLGVKRPLTLCAWDREVMGGDLEDFRVSWLTGPGETGRVVLRGWSARGYVQWTGTRFVHAATRETATRFMLQRLGS